MNIEEHFARMLRPIFPADMEITLIDEKTSDLVFRVRRKYSRRIVVRIDSAVIEDYEDDKTYRSTMDAYIEAHLRARVVGYMDDGVLDPPLIWEIAPAVYLPEPLLPVQ